MAITGIHTLLYSSEPERLRAVLRDVFGWDNVDAGHGWLIFALPPAELGVHPAECPGRHELSFMCDDLEATMDELRAKGIDVDAAVRTETYGRTVMLSLPGGVRVMLYEPDHAIAIDL